MPLTKLDEHSALIIIDLQKGIVGLPTVHPAGEIVERSSRLASAFRERDLPVVLVNVNGRAPGRIEMRYNFTPPPGFADLVPELDQKANDHIVTKQRLGAFIGTFLDDYLHLRGVTQIVLTGISTSSGVESTARSGYDLGYNVTFVLDAITDLDAQSHQHCVERVFPKLGETTTADDVMKLLQIL
jgi:nicotinamidase-related amidase